jgi:hypothetical protein
MTTYRGPVSGQYDAGEQETNTTEVTIKFEQAIPQLLFYPTVDSFIKLNDSIKEIFIPAESWTPVSILCTSVTVKAVEAGKMYWQGWFM